MLILATALIDWVWVVVVAVRRPHDWVELGWVGFALGQVAVLAGWLALGRWHILLRLAVVLTAGGILAFPVADSTPPDPIEWMSVLLLFGALIASPALMLRLAGFGFTDSRDAADTGHADFAAAQSRPIASSGIGPWQFSLGTLFSWTTSSAVLMAVMQYVDFPWHHAVEVVIYFAGFAAIALAVFWAVLFGNRLLPKTAIVLFLTLPTAFGLAHIEGGSGLYSLCFVLTLYCAAVGVVLRIAGYRVERISSRAAADADQSPAPADGEPGGEDECPV